MLALTHCVRTLAISLAIVLAIIDLTHGFTLRYEFVRPHDLAAEESGVHEVRHELKRNLAAAGRFDEGDEFSVSPAVLPIQAPVALPLVLTTEATKPNTTVQGDKKMEVTSALDAKFNENTGDVLEATVKQNEQQTGIDTTSIIMTTDITPTKQLKRVYNTPATITQEEATTVTNTFVVTNNYIEASANKEQTEDLDTNKISSVISTTTASPNVKETLRETQNNLNITAEPERNFSVETTPGWKKYTKIERKPSISNHITEEVTPPHNERFGDSLNAHTTESRVSLEKAFDLAPDKLSLQELRTHLMDSTNSIQTGNESQKTSEPETGTKSIKSKAEEESKTTELSPTEMVSLRAGYLDHTKSSVGVEAAANASRAGNEIEVEGVAYQMELHDDNEDTENMTSHSQLVEDAMKEEFLVEARLADTIRFLPTGAPSPSAAPSSTASNHDQLNEVADRPQGRQADQSTEHKQNDDLTVKPIKTLYTVNPNYKPLKKIDVQPMKPFMRDPDDNSWRNESLSSRGIVFKGTNSSKAFTEVLKNKTEIVMSNLTEQEKTIEKVELRDRLEIAAEKRKSKKKKIDKFGNTEYSDYEENNSGDTHSSKEKPSDVSEILLTTSGPTVLTKTVEWATIAPVVEESSPSADPYKTFKSVTFAHPTQDYYESKDDDADYASLSKIDILKSTPRPRVQWPVTQKILDDTKPKKQYLPDRQPTVQYFPPRSKDKDENTNNNYYHDDITNKLNVYGPLLDPKLHGVVEPTLSYTERNYPGKYPTAKYQPDENRDRPSDDNTNIAIQPIQHVEYRPVEQTDGRTFVIRHYKDLLESLMKDADYDRNANPYSQAPPGAAADGEGKTVKSEEYDYGQRKEELNRFVDNFNQNHVRFKADFPVVFNTSIVHGAESGRVLASSSAMFKRLYSGGGSGPGPELAGPAPAPREPFGFSHKPYDPACENVTVELEPAYELHYYVPGQEERDPDDAITYGYRS